MSSGDRGGARGRSRGISSVPRPPPVQQPPQSGQQPQPSSQPPQAGGSQVGAPSASTSERPGRGRGGVGDKAPRIADVGPPSVRGMLSANQPTNTVLFTRPATATTKIGSAGRKVDLDTNYVEVVKKPEWGLNAYRVDFFPEEDSTVVRKALFRAHKEHFGACLFEGTMLYCTKNFPDPIEFHGKRKNDDPYTIKVKFTHRLDATNPQYIQIFNIILRRALALLDLQLVGRDYYDLKARVAVPNFNFEVWPGVATSIRQHEQNVLLNVDITNKIMRQDTAYDMIACCQKRGPEREAMLRNALIGLTVITRYNNQTYRIDDVDFNSTPLTTFKKKNEDITFVKYYEDRYNIKIRYLNQPLLLSRPKARDIRGGRDTLILLIPELCNMTGLTSDMSNNFQLMKALSDHTRIRPAERMEKSMSLVKSISNCIGAKEELSYWGLALAPQLVKFKGRILPNEEIILGENRRIKTDQDADWTKQMRNQYMFRHTPLNNWAIIYPKKFSRDVDSFIKTIITASRGIRYEVTDPRFAEVIDDDRFNSYLMALNRVVPKNPNMVLIVVPNNKADRYGGLKINCCIDRPIPSQVILSKNLTSKGAMTVATKLAIQMNCKLGGAPWNVVIPFTTPVMIVGFDVCHDTKSKENSFGAMVATVDGSYTRYYSSVISHRNGEELSNYFGVQICQAMAVFHKNCGFYPSKIIVYRDGVGDGNIPYVFSHEIEILKKNLFKMTKVEPVMAFIIVSKRISTRFFYNRGNPLPGTVVDDTVTCPEKYDFFIVSQSVRQGTVSPTSYNVIFDNTKLTADVLQRLTYKLCHMYYNWSGTVRVPAPCQYAHKLAFLVGQHIHAPPSNSLDELLYFL